jgi:hypothetical protein
MIMLVLFTKFRTSNKNIHLQKFLNMKKLFVTLFVMASVTALHAQPPNVPADKGANFGEKTTEESAITFEQLSNELAAKKDGAKKINVKLKAVVTEVCSKEGCWIKIKGTKGNVMVKMKDHKFLVPLVLNEKEIVIDGIAEEKVTSVEMLKHYAEDANKSKAEIDAIKEPKKEIVIIAKGILVL